MDGRLIDLTDGDVAYGHTGERREESRARWMRLVGEKVIDGHKDRQRGGGVEEVEGPRIGHYQCEYSDR